MLAHNAMHVSIYIRASTVNLIQNSAKIYLNCHNDCFVESTFLCFVTVWEPNIPFVGTAWTTVVYCIMVDSLLVVWGLILWLAEQSRNWFINAKVWTDLLEILNIILSISVVWCNPLIWILIHTYLWLTPLYNCAETVCVYIVSIGCIQSLQGVF